MSAERTEQTAIHNQCPTRHNEPVTGLVRCTKPVGHQDHIHPAVERVIDAYDEQFQIMTTRRCRADERQQLALLVECIFEELGHPLRGQPPATFSQPLPDALRQQIQDDIAKYWQGHDDRLEAAHAPAVQDIKSAMREHKPISVGYSVDIARAIGTDVQPGGFEISTPLTRIADALLSAAPWADLEFSSSSMSQQGWRVSTGTHQEDCWLATDGSVCCTANQSAFYFKSEQEAVELMLNGLALDQLHDPKWLDKVPEGYTGPLWVREGCAPDVMAIMSNPYEWTTEGGRILDQQRINEDPDMAVQIPVRPAS